MQDKTTEDLAAGQGAADAIKSWMMVALTIIFVALYAAAVLGWLKPLADTAMITRLEPIIFVIIGYYFGRLPSQQNEKTLKNEITRQIHKADAAQQIKERAEQEREVYEEKIKNARIALTVSSKNLSLHSTPAERSVKALNGDDKSAGFNHSIETALGILNS